MMGGNISVESVLGVGSTFTVQLNNVECSESCKPDNNSEEEKNIGIDFLEAVLLIVDDNQLNRNMIIEFLQGSGVQIFEGKNGKEAVDLTLSHKPDIILLDLRMPVMDGYQAAKIIKGYSEIKNIPLISLSI